MLFLMWSCLPLQTDLIPLFTPLCPPVRHLWLKTCTPSLWNIPFPCSTNSYSAFTSLGKEAFPDTLGN
jgi:hypothetical protein